MGNKKLLDSVLREYFSIVETLKDKQKLPVIEGKMIVDRQQLIGMLGKYLYIKPTDKLEIYKKLNMLDVGKDRSCTKVIYDKKLKKSVRKFIFNYDTYETLKYLDTTEIEWV